MYVISHIALNKNTNPLFFFFVLRFLHLTTYRLPFDYWLSLLALLEQKWQILRRRMIKRTCLQIYILIPMFIVFQQRDAYLPCIKRIRN